MTQDTPYRRTWNWKRLLLLSIIGIGVLIGMMVAWVEVEYRVLVNELKSAGLPTNNEELLGFRTRNDFSAESANRWALATEDLQAALVTPESDAPHPLLKHFDVPPIGTPWAELDDFDALLVALKPQLDAIHRLAVQPGQSWDENQDSSDHRVLLYVLNAEVHVATHRSDSARAIRAFQSLVGLIRSERGNPRLMDLLSGIANADLVLHSLEQVLPHITWSDSELSEIQRSLQSIDLHQEFRFAMAGETVETLDMVSEEATFPFRTTNQVQVLRYAKDLRRHLNLPWFEMSRRFAEIDQRIARMKASGRLLNLPRKAFLACCSDTENLAQAVAVFDQELWLTIVGLGLQRQQLRTGSLPHTWDEIDPSLFGTPAQAEKLRIAPTDGQPVKLLVHEDHVLIGSSHQDLGERSGEGFRIYRIGFKPVK